MVHYVPVGYYSLMKADSKRKIMRRWKWGKHAIHLFDQKKLEDGVRDSICWITGRRGLSLTSDKKRVTCKFCLKIMEEPDER